MARYELVGPDGKRYEVTAPDDASERDVLAYFSRQLGAQNQQEEPGEADRALRRARNAFGLGLLDRPFDAVAAGVASLAPGSPGFSAEYARQRGLTERALARDDRGTHGNVADVVADTAGLTGGAVLTAPLTMARTAQQLSQPALQTVRELYGQLIRSQAPFSAARTSAAAALPANQQTTGQLVREAARVGGGLGAGAGYASDPSVEGVVTGTAGGSLLGALIPAGGRVVNAFAIDPIRNAFAGSRSVMADRANTIAREFAEAGVPEYGPALSGNALIEGISSGLAGSVFGDPLRRGAVRSIDAVEGQVRNALAAASSPAEAGRETQAFLRRQLTERSVSPTEIEAASSQRLHDISGVGISPRQNLTPPRVEPVKPEPFKPQRRTVTEEEVERALPAVDVPETRRPRILTADDVPAPPKLVRAMTDAKAEADAGARWLGENKQRLDDIRAELARLSEFADNYPRQVPRMPRDRLEGMSPRERQRVLAKESIERSLINFEQRDYARRNNFASLEEARAALQAAWTRIGELRRALARLEPAEQQAMGALGRYKAAQQELEVYQRQNLARHQDEEIARVRKEADELQAMRMAEARRSTRERLARVADAEYIAQRNDPARRAEFERRAQNRAADETAQRQREAEQVFYEDLARRQARLDEQFVLGRSRETYPTEFDAAYEQVGRNLPPAQVNPLGARNEPPTRLARFLDEVALEARSRGQLPGYREGRAFSETGEIDPALMAYLRPRLGEDVAQFLTYLSERRGKGQFSPNIRGLYGMRTRLGRALAEARSPAAPGATRGEDEALLARLYGVLTDEIEAATRAGPMGSIAMHQRRQIDAAYHDYLNNLRRPLARVFGPDVTPEQAIDRLAAAARRDGGNLSLLEAFYRVVASKGDHLAATSTVLSRMAQGDLPAFLEAYRGLAPEARRLMFSGSARSLGHTLDNLARVGGRLERYVSAARNAGATDLSRALRPSNIMFGLLTWLNVPIALQGAIGSAALSRLLASPRFAAWLKQAPAPALRGPTEWARHVGRLRAIGAGALGLNENALSAAMQALAGPAEAADRTAAFAEPRVAPPDARELERELDLMSGRLPDMPAEFPDENDDEEPPEEGGRPPGMMRLGGPARHRLLPPLEPGEYRYPENDPTFEITKEGQRKRGDRRAVGAPWPNEERPEEFNWWWLPEAVPWPDDQPEPQRTSSGARGNRGRGHQ